MQAEIDWAIVRESLLVVRDGIRAEIERLQARLSRVLATVMWSEAQLGIPVPEEIPVPVAEAKPAGAQRKTLRQRLVSGSRDVARRGTWPTRPDKSMAPAIGESLCSRVLAWLRSHPGVHRPDAIAVVLKARNKSVSDVCGKLAKLGEVKKAGYGEYAAVTTAEHAPSVLSPDPGHALTSRLQGGFECGLCGEQHSLRGQFSAGCRS